MISLHIDSQSSDTKSRDVSPISATLGYYCRVEWLFLDHQQVTHDEEKFGVFETLAWPSIVAFTVSVSVYIFALLFMKGCSSFLGFFSFLLAGAQAIGWCIVNQGPGWRAAFVYSLSLIVNEAQSDILLTWNRQYWLGRWKLKRPNSSINNKLGHCWYPRPRM